MNIEKNTPHFIKLTIFQINEKRMTIFQNLAIIDDFFQLSYISAYEAFG